MFLFHAADHLNQELKIVSRTMQYINLLYVQGRVGCEIYILCKLYIKAIEQ